MAVTAATAQVPATMRNSSKPRLLPLLVALLMAATTAACSKPVGDHQIQAQWSIAGTDGEYCFQAPFDTSGRFTLRLAARLVASRFPEKRVAFDIRTTAPDGTTAIERLECPFTDDEARILRVVPGSGSLTDFEWAWRTLTVSPGTWTFHIRPADPQRNDAIQGVGFSYSLNDGKR